MVVALVVIETMVEGEYVGVVCVPYCPHLRVPHLKEVLFFFFGSSLYPVLGLVG